ncbi:cation/H+ exchanger 3 [Medicago truncatula]|uniref:Cation/H+ exchanger 3 n=2 Tax=Medicago truncatula TaxID=3880 RepID=G7J2D9_MEDTR|nr:cation/H+ exchanger 3 [Medicago truncatula]
MSHDNKPFEVCFKNNRTVGSLGVWIGDNPLDFVLPVTLCQIILYFMFSRVLYCLLRPLQTPRFICSVLGGVLLGPTFLGRNETLFKTLYPLKQSTFLTSLAKIGASYFVFIYALKLDVTMTLKAAKRCWRFGVIPFLASFISTSILLKMYTPNGSSKTGSAYSIPNVFTVTSFAVVSQALTELNLMSTELGQIALSSAMITEMMQWVTITLQIQVKTMKFKNIFFAFIALGLCVLYILSFFFIVRPMARFIIQRTPIGKPLKEIYVVFVLLGVLIMVAISDALGLHFVIGPILFGLAMPNGPPLATTIVEKSELIVQELLMPFFFSYIGITTNLKGIAKNWKVVFVFQSILFVGFLAKVLACVFVAPTYNMRRKHGFVLGLILNIKGIMELIFFARQRNTLVINNEVYSQMVLYVVVMTGICIPLIKNMYKHGSRVTMVRSIHDGGVRTIQNTPENSEFNIICCMHNDNNVHSMIGLLEVCNPTQKSPLCVHVIHLTELLGKSTPILLPIKMKNQKALSIHYPTSSHILRAFENYSKNSEGPVTIHSYINVSPYNSMHEAICNLAEDKLVPLLIIPFHENDKSTSSDIVITSIRDLSINFQARAQCTVGILVDRNSRISMSTTKLSFNVAIFFIGGQDDREALALGIRMLDRPNTSVTLFCFIVHNNENNINNSGDVKFKIDDGEEEDETLENMLDESLIDEFKGKKLNIDNVVCHEIVVEGYTQLLEALRGLGNENYDLVMVGKRHNIGDLTDEEMTNFMENANLLGVFGEMLSSTEFCNGKVPILVLQCGEKKVNHFGKLSSLVNDGSHRKKLSLNALF